MSEPYRRHRATRGGPVVILVPVPVGGSPRTAREVKPRFDPVPIKSRRPPNHPVQPIPDAMRRDLHEQARRALRDARPAIEAMLAA
jgi:hypothetical protein